MILKELFVTDEIRCEFKSGLNVILGKNRKAESDSNDGKVSDTNGLGKTLIVNSIRHVLGADTEGALGSEFFARTKLWVYLTFGNDTENLVCIRPLWRPLCENVFFTYEGTRNELFEILKAKNFKFEIFQDQKNIEVQIDKSQIPVSRHDRDSYQKLLSKKLSIDYSKTNISLSSLMDFIARDEKVGFSDPISRIRRAQWVQYRSIQYLFGLPAYIEAEAQKLEEEIAGIAEELNAKRKRLSAKGINNPDKIENLKVGLAATLERVRSEISEVKVSPSLESVRNEYLSVKSEYAKIDSEINTKEHYLRSHKRNLKNLEEKAIAVSELLKVEEFYNDLMAYFPKDLAANISKFNTFFASVGNDREKYYADLISDLQGDLRVLRAEKEKVEPRLENLATQFRNTSVLRDIATLTSQEEKVLSEQRELEALKDVLVECDNLSGRLEELEELRKKKITEGVAEEIRGREKRIRLIGLFHEIVKEIYGTEAGALEFEYIRDLKSSAAGRTEIICTIPSQDSHGRTYAKINIFDFLWFLRPREAGEFDPCFLIHDGSYSKISQEVKLKMLASVARRLNGKQYIITANEGEIDLGSEVLKDAICCELDGSKTEGKFFREQF